MDKLNNSMVFPQYRQLSDVNVFYEILTDSHFIELKKIGNAWIKHEVVATQYPEKLRIMDMLNADSPYVKLNYASFIKMTK